MIVAGCTIPVQFLKHEPLRDYSTLLTHSLSSSASCCRPRCAFRSSRVAATSEEGGNRAAMRAEEALRWRLPAWSRVYFPGRRGGFPGRCVCGAQAGLGLRGLRECVWRRDAASPVATMSGECGAPVGPSPLRGVPAVAGSAARSVG